MVIGLYLAVARACYALVVLATAVLGAFLGFNVLTRSMGSLPAWTATAIFAAVFLFLGGGALIRRLRGAKLIPHPSDHGQWMFVFFMTVAGSFGHFVAGIVVMAIYQYRYVYPDREVEGGPLMFFLAIAAASYLAALLMGEFGLRHGTNPSSHERIKPSSSRADALPGNTLDSSAPEDTPR